MAAGTGARAERLLGGGLALLAVAVAWVPFHYAAAPGALGPLAAAWKYLPAALCVALAWQGARACRAGGADAGSEPGRGLGGMPLFWPMVGLLLAGLASAAGARYPGLSAAKTIYYFVTGGLVYLVVVGGVRRPAAASRLLGYLLVAAYGVALYGVLEFALGGNPLWGGSFAATNEAYRRLVPDPWFEGRIVSTVGHPVALGAYLAMLLPVSLAAALAAGGSRRLWLAGGTVVLGVALLLTFSRGAWLAAAAGVAVVLLWRGLHPGGGGARLGGRRLLTLGLVAITLAVVALAAASTSGVRDLAARRVTGAYQDYVLNFARTTRAAGYGYAAVIVDGEPLTGLGTGMYRFAAYRLRRELGIPTPVGVLDTPDNMYLMWLAENGGIGLAVAVYALLCLLRQFWRTACPGTGGPRQKRLLAGGFLAAGVVVAVDMLTVDALYFPVVRTTFWLLAGIGVVLVAPAATDEPAGRAAPGGQTC